MLKSGKCARRFSSGRDEMAGTSAAMKEKANTPYGTLNCFLFEAPITSMPLVPSRCVISSAT